MISSSIRHSKPKVKITKKPLSQPKLTSERDIALDFASSVHKRFDNIVKATVLFGSQAKNTATSASDIDVIIIIDDASINWDLELTAWYREELGRLVSTKSYSRDLHVNTIKLTTWWQDLMHGDPVVLNIVRYGEALIDNGFFNPLKALLVQGRINPTPEAVYEALQRAPTHLARSRMAQLGSIEGIYWAMVDSAQAALIMANLLPPSPEHVSELMKEHFVDKGMLKLDYVNWYRQVFAMHKDIIHGKITKIHGAEIDLWQERAENFVKKMTEVIDSLIVKK
ncbi:MAG: nucleotidyltransferase domain-containing protein [Nanoarchaeota archaeon]